MLIQSFTCRSSTVSLPTILVCSPILIFGSPGYYEDDHNIWRYWTSVRGADGLEIWFGEYGLFYRPVGIVDTTLMTARCRKAYVWLKFLAHALFVCSSYFVSLRILSKQIACYIRGFFFSTFPFNATAFLQLSSMHMIFTGLCCLILLHSFYNNIEPVTLRLSATHASLGNLLFSYEQITGLVTAFIILVLFKEYDQGIIHP